MMTSALNGVELLLFTQALTKTNKLISVYSCKYSVVR